MSVTKERKSELVEEYGAQRDGDTGSPEVQIAILTSRDCGDDEASAASQERLRQPPRAAGHGQPSASLLDYVKRTNPQSYLDLLRRLDIRK